MLKAVGFDADDTLWHDAGEFLAAERQLHDLVAGHVDLERFAAAVNAANIANLARYGYGVKSWLLSAIEVLAAQCSEGVPPALLRGIIDAGKTLLDRETRLLDGVDDVLAALRGRVELVLVTKGDLAHQERKLERSGLAALFDRVAIVSDKTAPAYRRIFGETAAAMVGNSMRSDILPAIEAGMWGLHVPHELTWDHEVADPPADDHRYRRFATIREAGEWIGRNL